MGDINIKNLTNLFNSVKSGDIKIGTAVKMIKGGTIGSGLLPTTGKPVGTTSPLSKYYKKTSKNTKTKKTKTTKTV